MYCRRCCPGERMRGIVCFRHVEVLLERWKVVMIRLRRGDEDYRFPFRKKCKKVATW